MKTYYFYHKKVIWLSTTTFEKTKQLELHDDGIGLDYKINETYTHPRILDTDFHETTQKIHSITLHKSQQISQYEGLYEWYQSKKMIEGPMIIYNLDKTIKKQ